MRIALFFGTLLALVTLPSTSNADIEGKILVPFLTEGRIDDGIAMLEQRIAEKPGDDHAYYALGIFHSLSAVENLSQDLHRYGLRRSIFSVQFLQFPTPPNPQPDELTYEKARQVVQEFVDRLAIAEESLTKIDPRRRVKLKIPFGLIRMDLDGDGKASEEETFWRVFALTTGQIDEIPERQRSYKIGFDKADVHWIRGYTHLLRAFAEIVLAHDSREIFDQSAHLFFAGAKRPEGLLYEMGRFGNPGEFADAIASIHMMRLQVTEPERMKKAHAHLKNMIAQSKLVWQEVAKENDNDREWIPNPRQRSITPLRITAQQARGWNSFLHMADKVLDGKKLVPHWRVPAGKGINVKKVFYEQKELDLVMWVHGKAALPYVEKGDVVTTGEASALNDQFQGQFWKFAIYLN